MFSMTQFFVVVIASLLQHNYETLAISEGFFLGGGVCALTPKWQAKAG
jgi:hypothetical protein